MKINKNQDFFKYVGSTPIVSIKSRILMVFILLILFCGFSTNLVSVLLSRTQITRLTNQILVNYLSEIYTSATNQYQISTYSNDREASVEALQKSAENTFSDYYENSVALAVSKDGSLLFFTSANPEKSWNAFTDKEALKRMSSDKTGEGSVIFTGPDKKSFFGVYKYHSDWDIFLIRAEQRSDTRTASYFIFGIITLVIILLTIMFIITGTKILSGLLGYINRFTSAMYEMQQSKKLKTIDISDAPNDDITYLAANFNSLSSTIDNLLQIFQKFVPDNVVKKARSEQAVRLEGSQQELTILFSDIKGFTYRTEILGNDIIDVLNVHYDSVIRKVSENNGIIGSIIGDAILASYGIDSTVKTNKSSDAIKTAWQITRVTEQLRKGMEEKKSMLEKVRPLSESEERIFSAVMLDVGVGIDGGTVFYGNIGSSQRMANTVIGDNVNSASRLESLTRIYKVPVIVSEYIKNETEASDENEFVFYEIDTVLLKGKTEGLKIYFPLDKNSLSDMWPYEESKEKLDSFEKALALYYAGDWKQARTLFKKIDLDLCSVFLERIGTKSSPQNWSGIWAMTSK
ncbi:MAG: adenylate/guanylate cyclase domain-containing protein [Treponema sp.]|nr:adenylate/guanylate cyclase domain-containing protein [Treponema sp.]